MIRTFLFSLVAGLTVALPLAAQPSLRAQWATAPITIDGKPDNPVWSTGKPSTAFVQHTHQTRSPASQMREVLIAYDSYAMYVDCPLYTFDSADE